MPADLANVAPTYRCKGDPLIIALPEAAGQTFVKGDFLTFTGGRVQKAHAAGTESTAGARGTGTMYVGIAEEDASGVTDTLIRVVIADTRTQFKLQLCTTDAKQAYSVSHTGNVYRLRNCTTGGWACNIANGNENTQVIVVTDPVLDYKNTTSHPEGMVYCAIRVQNQALYG